MGIREITPFRRVVKADGLLNEKFPGGTSLQAECLAREGHVIEPPVGKKPPKVKEFEKVLQAL